MDATYDIFKCNRCEFYDFSFFDNSPQRYCKTKELFLIEQEESALESTVGCKEHERAKKGKAQYLDESTFKVRHPK